MARILPFVNGTLTHTHTQRKKVETFLVYPLENALYCEI